MCKIHKHGGFSQSQSHMLNAITRQKDQYSSKLYLRIICCKFHNCCVFRNTKFESRSVNWSLCMKLYILAPEDMEQATLRYVCTLGGYDAMLGLVSVVKILKLCFTCIYVGMGYIGINGFN